MRYDSWVEQGTLPVSDREGENETHTLDCTAIPLTFFWGGFKARLKLCKEIVNVS